MYRPLDRTKRITMSEIEFGAGSCDHAAIEAAHPTVSPRSAAVPDEFTEWLGNASSTV